MSATATPVARRKSMPSAHAPKRDNTRLVERHGPASDVGMPQQLIDVDRIDPNPLQVRGREAFDDSDPELVSLSESLTSVRLISPIHVEESGQPGRWVLIAGERRLHAAKLAGWSTVPAFVCRGLTQAAKIQLAADENIERRSLNDIELARQLALLNKPREQGGAGMTKEAIAKRYGHKDNTWAVNILKLLSLPEKWQERIAAGELGQRQGKSLARYADRADVLGAVDMAYAKDRDQWATADAFDRQLAGVVERLDALKNAVPGGMVSQESAGYEATPMRTPARRSAPVDHSPPAELAVPDADGSELSVEAIARVLDSVFNVLDRLKPYDLGAVATYIDRRSRGVEGPEARLPSKRAKPALARR